jgi:hypothetical protein
MAANSGVTLARLKNNVANSTFTIWSSQLDAVNANNLRAVILETLGRDRVFVDVPKSLSDQLQLNASNLPRTSAADQRVSRETSAKAFIASMVTAILHKFK